MFISSIPKAAVNIACTLQELNSVFFYPLHLELMYVLNIEFIHLWLFGWLVCNLLTDWLACMPLI